MIALKGKFLHISQFQNSCHLAIFLTMIFLIFNKKISIYFVFFGIKALFEIFDREKEIEKFKFSEILRFRRT